MPITQSRILDLVTEFERHLGATRRLTQCLDTALSRLSGEDLREAIKAELYAYREVPIVHVIYERRWFDSHSRRNDRIRERMEAQRRERGVQPRSSDEYRMERHADGQRALSGTRASDWEREYNEAMGGRPITEEDIRQAIARKAQAQQALAQHEAAPDTQSPDTDEIDVSQIPVLERTQAQLDEERERGTVDVASELL